MLLANLLVIFVKVLLTLKPCTVCIIIVDILLSTVKCEHLHWLSLVNYCDPFKLALFAYVL